MPVEHTTIGSWAVLVAKALDSYGYDGEAVCKDFGVDLKEAGDPVTRYSTDLMGKLWNHGADLSGDPFFGLKAGTFVSPSSFYALSVSMWMSDSLLEALRCMERHVRVFSTAGSGEVVERDDCVILSTHVLLHESGQPVITNQGHEASVSALLSLCRALYGESLRPLKVDMTQKDPTLLQGYEQFFGCPVSLGSSCFRLYFDRQAMLKTLPTANADLLAHSEELVLNYLARIDERDIVNRVRKKLVELLPMGEPSREAVADALNMSLRNLQRKLQEEDTSYKDLLDDVRRDLAVRFIRQPHLSLGEISFRLGFSTSSSFARAFKRWMGVPPGEFRQQKFGSSPDQ